MNTHTHTTEFSIYVYANRCVAWMNECPFDLFVYKVCSCVKYVCALYLFLSPSARQLHEKIPWSPFEKYIHVDHHNLYIHTHSHTHPCTNSKIQKWNETKQNQIMWIWTTYTWSESTFVKWIPYGRLAFINCLFGSFNQHFTTQNETKYRHKNDTSANAITKWRLEHNICHMNEKHTHKHTH